MPAYIPELLRARIHAADRGRCAYCLTSEANSGISLTLDHIQPRSQAGASNFENLCLACRSCNEYKADTTDALDPLTETVVPPFNPRTQVWSEHFTWSADGTNVVGLTAIGRATVLALRVNNPTVVSARRRWVSAGWHPPAD